MKKALDCVNEKILTAFNKRQPSLQPAYNGPRPPRLVAVSKLKPNSAIIEAYQCGQRYFGENYIQELVEKSNSKEIIENCPEIQFHFIGHLQTNKVNKLLRVRNLHMVETVDSIRLADLIEAAIERMQTNSPPDGDQTGWQMPKNEQLKVMIQVNTSGEEQKGGVDMSQAEDLAEHIANRCRWLNLAGLMTIGRLDGWGPGNPNLDFKRLVEVREKVSRRLSVEACGLELSMGMSSDFEEAIEMGSTSVRVGTMIFGARQSKS